MLIYIPTDLTDKRVIRGTSKKRILTVKLREIFAITCREIKPNIFTQVDSMDPH